MVSGSSSRGGHSGGGVGGVAFLVSAAAVYDIVAATNSSPQTTEINAKARSRTLMKWVWIGLGQGLVFVFLAAAGDARNRAAILWGGTLATVAMWAQYVHARNAGLRSEEPATEDYTAPTHTVNGFTGRRR